MNIRFLLQKVKNINLHNWYAPFIVTFVFSLIFFVCFTPIYETNDDVFFTLIANGFYTKEPSPFFQINTGFQTMHIGIGRILVALYSLSNNVNWYSIMMYTLGCLGLYALLIPIFHTIKNRLLLGLSTLLILLFVSRLFLFLSFTSIAAIGTMGGVYLLLFLFEKNKGNFFYYTFAILLLFYSQLVRQTSFIMIMILSLPFIIKIVVARKKKLNLFLIASVLTILSIFLVSYSNIAAYKQNNAWREKMNFLLPLGTFFYEPNTFNYEKNRAIYKKIGWSKNDYAMFTSFFYDDERIFSADKLHTLLTSKGKFQINFQSLIKSPILILYLLFTMIEYTFICITCFVLAWPNIQSKDKKYLLFGIGLVIAFMLYFVYKGYIPIRVTLSMLFFINYIILFSISDMVSIDKNISERLIFKYIFVFSLCMALLMRLGEQSSTNKDKIAKFKHISTLLPSNNKLTLIWGSTIPYEWQYVFSTNKEFKSIHFLIGAWEQRSPLNETIKKKFSIQNTYLSLIENGNLYLVVNDYQKNLLTVFFREHYGYDVTYKTIKQFEEYNRKSYLLKVLRSH